MNNLIVGKSQLVEAPILGTPGLGLEVNFADIPNISKGNIKLYGIEAFTADQMSVSPSGLTVIASADAALIGVTLVTMKDEKIMENQAYYNLIRSNNGGFIMLLNNYQINLTKCYMTLNGAGGMSTDETGLFMLYYDLI